MTGLARAGHAVVARTWTAAVHVAVRVARSAGGL